MANTQLTKESLPKDVDSLTCTGSDLRGCPDNAKAIWETKTDKTWKQGVHWVFVCDKCAQKLIEK